VTQASVELGGLPVWELHFDADGRRRGHDGATALIRAAARGELADLLVFSHCRNNDRAMARAFENRFIEQLAAVASCAGVSRPVGVAVVSWPSMQWPGDQPEQDDRASAPAAMQQALHALFADPVQQGAADTALALLRLQPEDHIALERFQGLLSLLAEGPPLEPEDDGKAALVERPAHEAFDAVAALDSRGHGNGFKRLWAGAEHALRLTSYYQMKKRARVIAAEGLAPALTRLLEQPGAPRVHLVGHSAGAQVIAFALRGLERRPVQSMTLMQATFSHFAFAESLPFAPDRAGGLAGLRRRVDGPILVTHSVHDLAVGHDYARASMLGHDGGRPLDARYRWAPMGFDGAQCCEAVGLRLEPAGHDYPFAPGKVFNLDGDDVIRCRRGRGGAHNDIHHPELAWAVLRAAQLA
jgi:pimeloyl-ACP methyl ester carboxylesterase